MYNFVITSGGKNHKSVSVFPFFSLFLPSFLPSLPASPVWGSDRRKTAVNVVRVDRCDDWLLDAVKGDQHGAGGNRVCVFSPIPDGTQCKGEEIFSSILRTNWGAVLMYMHLVDC